LALETRKGFLFQGKETKEILKVNFKHNSTSQNQHNKVKL